MEVWLDANISPAIASWMRREFSIGCFAVRDLGLRDATDTIIFKAAKVKGEIVIVSKDEDFCNLLITLKPPPKIIWLTFGNCSNVIMKEILRRDFRKALDMLGENDLVEICS
jgi:predicted nuclease of predicted toxin-antitoxin system